MSVISMAVLRPASSSASDELRATLERQRSAFLESAPPSLEERRTDLAKLGTAMRESAPRLAEAISADFGNRSRHETMLAEVFTTLAGIRHASRHLAQWMKPKRVSVSLELMPARARILYQPLGVVGIISPWNYPFQLAMMPLLAALAAGNRVMLKPSELTPRTGEFMAELLAGLFPSEKVATVLGGADIGAAFSRLPFDHLFYTGSTAVGRLVMQAAAENLTPVTLELGGKSPCILGEDAALAGAAQHRRHLLAREEAGQQLRHELAGARRQFRGLQHHAVAGGERREHRHHRQLEGVIPRADDADDAQRLIKDARPRRHQLEADGDALRSHPVSEMARGVADAGERREHFGQHGLVPRAVAEIGGDRFGQPRRAVANGRTELRQIGAALREGGRRALEEGRALALEGGTQLVVGAR